MTCSSLHNNQMVLEGACSDKIILHSIVGSDVVNFSHPYTDNCTVKRHQ